MSWWKGQGELEDLLRKKKIKKGFEPLLFIENCFNCRKPLVKNIDKKIIYQLGCKCDVPHEFYFDTSGKYRWHMHRKHMDMMNSYGSAITGRWAAHIDMEAAEEIMIQAGAYTSHLSD